jgi:hypothetical protein
MIVLLFILNNRDIILPRRTPTGDTVSVVVGIGILLGAGCIDVSQRIRRYRVKIGTPQLFAGNAFGPPGLAVGVVFNQDCVIVVGVVFC